MSSLPSISSSQYKVLSFDLYGTLLDWSAGIYPHLTPLLDSTTLPQDHPYRLPFSSPYPHATSSLPKEHPLIAEFSRREAETQDNNPTIEFENVLYIAYIGIGQETGATVRVEDVEAVVTSSRSWPPFPDTVEAMHKLKEAGYKLIAISNNSNAGLAAVLAGPLKDVHFDRAYSAEEIGSYKGDLRNFEHLLKGVAELGREQGEEWGKEQLLHVAHGVGSDHVPCDKMGIRHIWVERGVDNWKTVDRNEMKLLEIVSDVKELSEKLLRF
jgi:FMN phosphatase YigB (HAD superfamily)